MLFKRRPEGLKKVENHRPPPPETLKYTEREGHFAELLPGQCLKRNTGDPLPFCDQLVLGEKYELLWPGAEYALWDWGTLREHVGPQNWPGHGSTPCYHSWGSLLLYNCYTGGENLPTGSCSVTYYPGTPYPSVYLEGPSEMILGE
ncbi:uncharacterized protein N7482_000974 [Penicillium canariense]|uniref:Uncharacterized protein n=1 Tax=Penicillium canariense TaxID=189055 RepID=A0A9W9LTN2_9EURO|nr:uncharacterized protein N7482_000974 [Penicillium canariense]KAJ5175097.1 hypothetical protein N7482_000974 [Penicillium canariense]